MESVSLAVKIALVALGLIATLSAWIRSRQRYRKLEYLSHSHAAGAPWRWRAPDQSAELQHRDGQSGARLRVEQTDHASVLHLPVRKLFIESVGRGLGLMLAGMMAFAMVSRAWGIAFGTLEPLFLFEWVPGMLIIGMGLALQFFGSRVARIERSPESLVLAVDIAFRMRWHYRIRRESGPEFQGKPQSLFGLDRGQDMPDYFLRIRHRRRGWFPRTLKLLLSVNQTQGDWIVGGLQDWTRATRSELTPPTGHEPPAGP